MNLVIPFGLRKNMLDMHGEAGEAWLNNLPYLLKHYEKEWQCELGDCFGDASFNYVAPARLLDGSIAVLKCGIHSATFDHEVAALQHFNAQGAVKLIQVDKVKSIMLLEHIEPGTLLENYPDEEQATVFAVEVIKKLHHPVKGQSNFPSLRDWFKGLYGDTSPVPKAILTRAQAISAELLNSMGDQVLLHGDLHYANILLSHKRGWLAIDPKGVVGEREYEISLPRLNDKINKKILIRHLERFIEVSGFDKQRVMDWMFAKAVLAACWSYEDNGEIWQPFLDCAQDILDYK